MGLDGALQYVGGHVHTHYEEMIFKDIVLAVTLTTQTNTDPRVCLGPPYIHVLVASVFFF